MTPTEISSAAARTLYEYWRDKGRALGRPMARRDLDPTEFCAFLPNILLIEVVGGELRFRIAGDEVEKRYGLSLRGRPVSDTFRLVRRKDTSSQWSEIMSDGRPKYRRGPMRFPDGRTFVAERILMPMSNDGKGVHHIFGAIFYEPVGTWEYDEVVTCGDIEDGNHHLEGILIVKPLCAP